MRKVVLAAAVVGLVSGCGGGSGRLSKAEYAKRADAICTKYNAKIRALGRPTAISGLPAYVDKALPLARKGDDELRALEPPKDEQRLAALKASDDPEVAGLAEKIDREEAYHRMHAQMWFDRLRDEPRFTAALEELRPLLDGDRGEEGKKEERRYASAGLGETDI